MQSNIMGIFSKRLFFLSVILSGLFFFTKVQAATYYVAPAASGGNNNAAGTLAAPWATFNYANSRVTSGDTVYVRGGTYNQVVYLDKAGVTWQAYTGESPVIDGGWPGTLAGDNIGLPSGTNRYSALVFINAGNITFDGFEVRYSRGRGIEIYGAPIDGVILRNCKSHHTYNEALIFIGDPGSSKWVTNGLVEHCEFYNGAMVRPIANPGSDGIPATVLLTRFNGLIFRYNKVHDSYYDGLLIGGNVNGTYASTGALVEYNQIYGNYQDQLVFTSCHNNIARYNLIYGTYPNANGEKGRGSGIWLGNESGWNMGYMYAETYIYGNVIANTLVNMWVEGQASSLAIYNSYWYNNTSIEATSSNFYVTWPSTGHIFKNNIIIQSTGTIGYAPAGSITADYNIWSATPSSNLIGSHDATYTSNPLAKTTGWSNLSSGSLTGSEFAPQGGSSPINKGTTLTAVGGQTLNQALNLAGTNFSTGQLPLLSQDNNGSGWEIGAGVYVESSTDTVAPGRPTGLFVQ